MAAPTPLPPGSVIGCLGTGQLGRMLALAAAPLGYVVHGFGPTTRSPLHQVTGRCTTGAYNDRAALATFADAVDVVTYEFENVPGEAAAFLAERVPVRPGPQLLHVSQDRLVEKRFAEQCGARTAPFRGVYTRRDLTLAVEVLGVPAVLKTRRFGYDGKGQVVLRSRDPAVLDEAWLKLRGVPCILEGFVDFAFEASVVVARGLDGAIAAFPLVENIHRDHILWQTRAPAQVDPEVARRAQDLAVRMARLVKLEGVMAVELFVEADGTVRVNEIAPRTHNSGHWTQDGCAISQFEQQVRAITGLPLGPTDVVRPTVMTNLLGEDVLDLAGEYADPCCRVHLYGKEDIRPGRKMGHVNRLG
ncbi:MAG: 5-(carboxyamino)imidazole ribonucleotide synthase [Deltaproteobacteria bacterium]|nr:5-(carboxyamino)imidazole ribonucleotide synthase [Deltaproteobacteria bacterium]